MDAAGKAGQPVDIWGDQPVKGPDGMRASNGKLLLAENGSGKISVITINGDKASVTVIKEGLKTPTAVEPAGDTNLGRRTRRRQGCVDSDAEMSEDSLRTHLLTLIPPFAKYAKHGAPVG